MINIRVNVENRQVFLDKTFIGNELENLQETLNFKLENGEIDGQGRLEYINKNHKNYVMLDHTEEGYSIPVKNVITKEGNVNMQLVITESGEYIQTQDDKYKAHKQYYSEEDGIYILLIEGEDYQVGDNIESTIYEYTNIPVFKSNVFYLYCGKSINAVEEAPEGYELWIERANAILNQAEEAIEQIENIEISQERVEDGAEITIKDKEGEETTTKVNDGATFTPNVDDEGNISWTNNQELPNPETKNIKGSQGYTPVRGVDYWTEQDKQEIIGDVAEDTNTKIEAHNNDTTAHPFIQGIINSINSLIPNQATESNQLADKDFVNSSINSVTAFYITKNANGDQFNTKAELDNASVFYSGGETRVPTRNDYCYVLEDETKQDPVTLEKPSTRYIYQNGQWEFQFIVNKTSLTSAQLYALNSGITEALTNQITTNQTNITNLQNAIGTINTALDLINGSEV